MGEPIAQSAIARLPVMLLPKETLGATAAHGLKYPPFADPCEAIMPVKDAWRCARITPGPGAKIVSFQGESVELA